MAGDTGVEDPWRYFPTQPSRAKAGDMVVVVLHEERLVGTVVRVLTNGAWVGPVNECGVRLLAPAVWCHDDDSMIEEINGESLFEL